MKKTKTELWIVGIIFVSLVSVVFIYSTLDSSATKTPRVEFQIEIAKTLMGFLAVGVLAVWAKQLFDRRWTVQQMIQDAVTNAYEQLDNHLREFADLVTEELITQEGSNKAIRHMSSYSRVEALVRLWLPDLDQALKTLKTSVTRYREQYHEILLDLRDVAKQNKPIDENELAKKRKSIPDPGEWKQYLNFLEGTIQQQKIDLVKRLRTYANIVEAMHEDIKINEATVSIIEKLLKQNALELIGKLDKDIEEFKNALAMKSREFLGDHLGQKIENAPN